ncbi:MAG: sugar ABC transporter permease [Ruminococcaceae bacterium]|nr:sugar ABC transporter permease [Oscillospiraceae bacterium]
MRKEGKQMTNEVKLEKAPKRRKIASLDKRKARVGWIFVLPFLIGFVFIYLPMLKDSLVLAFSDMTVKSGGGIEFRFIGFENFQYALFTDAGFVQTLVSGIGELVFEVPAILLFSLFMAVLLNQKMAGRAAFRAIFFLPVVLATGIMETIEASNILGSYMGETSGIDDGSGSSAASQIVSAMDIEALFENMKIGTELVEYVVQIINDIYAIVNRSGVQMLIFLAGLQSISPAIYEACKIDGATGWETFWKITFPMISPMILVNAVYTIIDSFTTQSNTVMSYISGITTPSNTTEISTAMSWIYFLIVVVILAAVAGIMSMYVFYQRKD